VEGRDRQGGDQLSRRRDSPARCPWGGPIQGGAAARSAGRQDRRSIGGLGEHQQDHDAGDADRRFGGAGQRGDRTRAHVLAGALACRHRTRGPDDSVPQQDVSGILRAPSSVLTSLSDRDGRMSCPSTTYQVRVGDQPQGRKGAWHRDACQRARARRRGDRMMEWMAPLRHLSAKLLSDRISSKWEPSMGEVTTIGLELAKHVFQVHGVDAEGATVLRKQLRRAQVLAFFSRLPPCLVGLEACATAHYWGRELRGLGQEVGLMAAQYVKAYIKRNKHDAADAEAICEAVGRPTMRFVPVKTSDQQAAVLLHRGRERLVRQRTGLVNALRGHLA